MATTDQRTTLSTWLGWEPSDAVGSVVAVVLATAPLWLPAVTR